MDPLVTSSLISAGSSILGGLFGGSKKGPSVADQIGMQGAMMRDQFEGRLALGKIHNIHPLTMLGVPMSGGQVTGEFGSSGPSKSERMAEIGQGVSRAVSAYAGREQREMEKMSAKLQLENQQLQNDRLRSEIALMHSPGSPPGIAAPGNVTGDQDARYPAQERMPVGIGNAAPLLRIGVDQKGNPVRVYNDELGDNETLQLLTSFGYTVPDWLHGNIGRPAGKALANPRFSGRKHMTAADALGWMLGKYYSKKALKQRMKGG